MPAIRMLVYSNFWIAIAAALLTTQAELIFEEPGWPLPTFSFFGTLSAYSFLRFIRLRQIDSSINDRFNWMSRYQQLLIAFILIGALGTLAVMSQMSTKELLIAVAGTGITILYGLPLKPLGINGLRDVPMIKIFLIAIAWTMITSLLPLQTGGFSNEEAMYAVAQGLFIFGITIPFDIRDLLHDPKKQRTIPQILGIPVAKAISTALLVIAIVIHLSNSTLEQPIRLALTMPLAIGIPLSMISSTNLPELYYTGILDGLMILQGILVISASFS